MKLQAVAILAAIVQHVSATTWTQWKTFSEVEEHCTDLLNFTGTEEAPTRVDEAFYVPYNETSHTPPYCYAIGYINVYNRFHIRLPAVGANWTGVFTQQGCGGSCGVIQLDGVHPLWSTLERPFGESTGDACMKRGYIAAMTDMGHDNTLINVTSLTDFTFAHNNRTAELNFATLSTHLTTVMGKAMAKFYYGTPVQFSYFVGGSTGGRQALIEAQRYPADYQGIVCGFPAMHQLGIGIIQNIWFGMANRDENKRPILLPVHADSLAKAALRSCDHLDGLVDGLIDNPDLCTIDFGLVMCDSRRSIVNSSACLTDRELAVAKKFYQAPTDANGNVILSAAALPGSESYWDRQGWLGTQRATDGSGEGVTLGNLINRWNNLAFEFDPSPAVTSIDELDLNLDTVYSRTAYMESIFNAGNADLTIFKRLGGKLILSQGWPDVNVPAHFLVDYYRRLVHVFGEKETEGFVKLFMSNGQNHVQSYGLGASAGQDPYSRIAEWVEDGVEPQWFNGTKYDATNGTFLFSRPAFPFPYYAMYDGVGDPNLQESFYPVKRLTLFGNAISS